jgi:hypothetical protein
MPGAGQEPSAKLFPRLREKLKKIPRFAERKKPLLLELPVISFRFRCLQGYFAKGRASLTEALHSPERLLERGGFKGE